MGSPPVFDPIAHHSVQACWQNIFTVCTMIFLKLLVFMRGCTNTFATEIIFSLKIFLETSIDILYGKRCILNSSSLSLFFRWTGDGRWSSKGIRRSRGFKKGSILLLFFNFRNHPWSSWCCRENPNVTYRCILVNSKILANLLDNYAILKPSIYHSFLPFLTVSFKAGTSRRLFKIHCCWCADCESYLNLLF